MSINKVGSYVVTRGLLFTLLIVSLPSLSMEKEFLENKTGVAFGIFGAPASGKGYVQRKIQEQIKFFKKIEENLKTEGPRKDLTIDIIRKNAMDMPGVMQLSLLISTFYWLRELKKAYPAIYLRWWNEFTGQGEFAEKAKKAKMKGEPTSQLNIWEIALESCLGQKVVTPNLKDETLVLTIDGKEIESTGQFLHQLAGKFKNELNNLKGCIGAGWYPAFMYPNRYIQYRMLVNCFHVKKPIYFDESGADFPPTADRLRLLHKGGYVVIIFLIQRPDIGINFMQNVYRVIKGTDGARDAGSSIVWTYLKLEEEAIEQYKKMAEEKIEVTDIETLNPWGAVISAIEKATVADDTAKGNKPIDVFVKISASNLKETYERISKRLGEMFKKDKEELKLLGIDVSENIYMKAFKLLVALQAGTYLDNLTRWTPEQRERLERDGRELREAAKLESSEEELVKEVVELIKEIKEGLSKVAQVKIPVLQKAIAQAKKGGAKKRVETILKALENNLKNFPKLQKYLERKSELGITIKKILKKPKALGLKVPIDKAYGKKYLSLERFLEWQKEDGKEIKELRGYVRMRIPEKQKVRNSVLDDEIYASIMSYQGRWLPPTVNDIVRVIRRKY